MNDEAKKVPEERTTRFGVSIPDDLNDELNKLIPYGVKTELFRKLVYMYRDAVQRHGKEMLVRILDDQAEIAPKK